MNSKAALVALFSMFLFPVQTSWAVIVVEYNGERIGEIRSEQVTDNHCAAHAPEQLADLVGQYHHEMSAAHHSRATDSRHLRSRIPSDQSIMSHCLPPAEACPYMRASVKDFLATYLSHVAILWNHEYDKFGRCSTGLLPSLEGVKPTPASASDSGSTQTPESLAAAFHGAPKIEFTFARCQRVAKSILSTWQDLRIGWSAMHTVRLESHPEGFLIAIAGNRTENGHEYGVGHMVSLLNSNFRIMGYPVRMLGAEVIVNTNGETVKLPDPLAEVFTLISSADGQANPGGALGALLGQLREVISIRDSASPVDDHIRATCSKIFTPITIQDEIWRFEGVEGSVFRLAN